MVFSKFPEIFSSGNRFSAPKPSNDPYSSPGLPPLPGPLHGFRFANIGRKNNIRLSSSLQDFSRYQQVDPEVGDNTLEFQKNSANAKQGNLLLRENPGSSFSKEKASLGIASKRKKWIRVILVFLCLLLFAFLVYLTQYLYFNSSREEAKYYVVLDCGSTGTRVYVYQATKKQNKDGSLPISMKSLPEGFKKKSNSQSGRAYNRMETEPGFDKLVHNISSLRKAIKPLIRWSEKQIPRHAHKTTSLFLYATAGVRRLPSSDSEWLLNNAFSILQSSSFLCKKEWVKIISGMEEAYYGWIALNYHTGVLGTVPKKQTFGALDLGGSSLQVTFETKEALQDETGLELSIGPVNHHLSAYSLSGYGLNDAFDKSVAYLLRRHPHLSNADLASGNFEVKHPCLQSGYKEQYSCSQCSSLSQDSGTPLSGEKKLGPKTSVQLVGAPKWEDCSALVKIAVNLSEWSDQTPGSDCEVHPCALAQNQPRPYGQFYAMSGFFVVYRFFNLTPDAALDDVLEKGKEFCEKTWDVAKKSVAPQPFIEQYCFRSPYIVTLLREGLHITDSNVIIGSGSITWTLGVALLEAGKAVPTNLKFQNYGLILMKMNPIVIFSILIISLLALLCALSRVCNCNCNWTSKLFRKPFLPLFGHNSGSATSVLRFQRWSPISSGDGKVKMPLSPTIGGSQQRAFDTGHVFSGSGVQLSESSLYPSSSSVSHSYSSGSLGQMQFDGSTMVSFWSPHRGQVRLQSRRSQSREDLNSSLAEAHLSKV